MRRLRRVAGFHQEIIPIIYPGRGRFTTRPLLGLGARALADLFASDLPSILAVIVRFTEARTNAFMMRLILDRFSRSALRPSDTHCSTLSGFIGMVRGSNPSLPAPPCLSAGRHDGNVDAQRLERVVERFPETVDIRLGATVIPGKGLSQWPCVGHSLPLPVILDPDRLQPNPVSTRINHVANDDESACAPSTSQRLRIDFSSEEHSAFRMWRCAGCWLR